jgi:hypothetical protein
MGRSNLSFGLVHGGLYQLKGIASLRISFARNDINLKSVNKMVRWKAQRTLRTLQTEVCSPKDDALENAAHPTNPI